MKKKSWEDQQREKHGITAPKFTLYVGAELQDLLEKLEAANENALKKEKEWREAKDEPSAYRYTAIYDAYQDAMTNHENALQDLGRYVLKVWLSLSLRPEE